MNKSAKQKSKLPAPQGVRNPRIVSLVPSLTELVCELGLGPYLVGRTGFCVHPRQALVHVPKLGGTKQVDETSLLALAPTHLIVNKDENEQPLVERLQQFIPDIIVTHPMRVEDNFGLYLQFAKAFEAIPGVQHEAQRLHTALQDAMSMNLSSLHDFPAESVLYLIWKNPWMSVASNTYIASMLASVGWRTVVPDSASEEPLAETGAKRYPVLADDDVLQTRAQRILLSTEPYSFRQKHVDALTGKLGAAGCPKVSLIDGEMCSWYGPRAIQGLHYLRQFRQTLSGPTQ